jgi:hypothetical protein
MNNKHQIHIWAAIASVAGVASITLACSLFTGAAPAPAPSPVPFELPTGIPPNTAVASPTSAPQPTVEPTVEDTAVPLPAGDVAATEAASQVMTDIQDFYARGYLPFENGELYSLDDFSKTRPSGKVFDFTRAGQQSQDFALSADIELDTTGSTTYPHYTGCGFAYRVQNNSDGYTAILTNEAVRMGYCYEGLSQCELFGTTHGTGLVDVRDQSKAHFSLVVNRDSASVLVDGILVGQYTLFTTKLLGMGDLYYGVVSDINSGYWTSCKISNVKVWESMP